MNVDPPICFLLGTDVLSVQEQYFNYAETGKSSVKKCGEVKSKNILEKSAQEKILQ